MKLKLASPSAGLLSSREPAAAATGDASVNTNRLLSHSKALYSQPHQLRAFGTVFSLATNPLLHLKAQHCVTLTVDHSARTRGSLLCVESIDSKYTSRSTSTNSTAPPVPSTSLSSSSRWMTCSKPKKSPNTVPVVNNDHCNDVGPLAPSSRDSVTLFTILSLPWTDVVNGCSNRRGPSSPESENLFTDLQRLAATTFDRVCTTFFSTDLMSPSTPPPQQNHHGVPPSLCLVIENMTPSEEALLFDGGSTSSTENMESKLSASSYGSMVSLHSDCVVTAKKGNSASDDVEISLLVKQPPSSLLAAVAGNDANKPNSIIVSCTRVFVVVAFGRCGSYPSNAPWLSQLIPPRDLTELLQPSPEKTKKNITTKRAVGKLLERMNEDGMMLLQENSVLDAMRCQTVIPERGGEVMGIGFADQRGGTAKQPSSSHRRNACSDGGPTLAAMDTTYNPEQDLLTRFRALAKKEKRDRAEEKQREFTQLKSRRLEVEQILFSSDPEEVDFDYLREKYGINI